jgi:transcriptional regulator with XRE-family HTH domain
VDVRLNLKRAILAAGLSQRELARGLGMPEQRLSGIVRGWTDPTREERKAIAERIGRSPRSLFLDFDAPSAA